MTAIRNITLAALVAALPLTAVAQNAVRLNVDVHLTDGAGDNTLKFWPRIEEDLEEAIAQKVAQLPDGDDMVVRVRLNEVSFSGSERLNPQGAFNYMEGWVFLMDELGAPPKDQVKVILNAEAAPVGDLPENTVVLPAATEAYYDALIDAFAENTRDAIEAL